MSALRVGIGFDIHALKRGRPLWLGGVRIPHPKGLVGHSDGDVLLHAILDACLGAMGEGDIGDFFSNRDPRWKRIRSLEFVRHVRRRLKKRKLKVFQIDSTIIAERPQLGAWKPKIGASLAKAFGVPRQRVGVKAKTHEGFGAIGNHRAIASMAIVTLKR